MSDHSKIVVQIRSEVGETIHSWVLLRHFLGLRRREATGDLEKDMRSQNLWFLDSVIERLENDAIARLAELADSETRNKRTFAHARKALRKVGLVAEAVDHEISRFKDFVTTNRFVEKRNQEISHKTYVNEWADERAPIHIQYRILLEGVSRSVRTIKAIDALVYGKRHSTFFWQSLRRERYRSALPARVEYLIAEHIHLPESVRAQIIVDEIRAGKFHQDLMDATVNGIQLKLYVSKKWGAINLGGHLHILPQYPLQSIVNIEGSGIAVDPAWKADLVPLQDCADAVGHLGGGAVATDLESEKASET